MFIGVQEQANQANGPIIFSMPHLPQCFMWLTAPMYYVTHVLQFNGCEFQFYMYSHSMIFVVDADMTLYNHSS